LHSPIISRIENDRLSRGCSLKQLLAFGAANGAIWSWQTEGVKAAWARYGPHTDWAVKSEWLDDAIWLPVPDDQTHPLEFADLAEVLVGRLELPYLGAVSLGHADAEAMSGRLSDLLNAAIATQALPPREGLAALMAAYPTRDPNRQSRLMALLMGSGRLSRDELESELYAMAETLRVLRDLPAGSYGPGDLAAELSKALPPSE
jgi:hypothetical protein